MKTKLTIIILVLLATLALAQGYTTTYTKKDANTIEVTISAASATAALFDRNDFEPDGVIELTFEMDADNLTGTASSPFIHFVDIHYQTSGLIGTKNRTPDFYS